MTRLVEELAKNQKLDNSKIGKIPEWLQKWLQKLFYVQFDNSGLKTVLEENLAEPQQSLAELKKKVLVATFQLYNHSDSTNPSWRPITLDNLPKNPIKSEDTIVLDAALCTSAAPSYFPPYDHPDYGFCIDGGVFANNPSTLALARVLYSGILGEGNIQNIRMLSIGTGQTQNYLPPSYQPGGPLRYGVKTWFRLDSEGATPRFPLLSILMDSSSIIDDFQTNMFLGNSQYQRMNVELTEPVGAFGCSQIALMEQLVDEYIQSPEWNENITWIENNFL